MTFQRTRSQQNVQSSHALFFYSLLYRKDQFSLPELLELMGLSVQEYLFFPQNFMPQASYYSHEMGPVSELKKGYLFRARPEDKSLLVSKKLNALKQEEQSSLDGRRTVNIDPGYVGLENVVLSSIKNYSHRLWTGDGVYLELELIYKNKQFCELEWTYPDYCCSEVKDLFSQMRGLLKSQLEGRFFPS